MGIPEWHVIPDVKLIEENKKLNRRLLLAHVKIKGLEEDVKEAWDEYECEFERCQRLRELRIELQKKYNDLEKRYNELLTQEPKQ